MKVAFFLLGLFALEASCLMPPVPRFVADKTFLNKQKTVIELLWGVTQPSVAPEIISIAHSYNIEKNIERYINPEVVKRFLTLYKYGLLPKDEVFTVLNQETQNEAFALFNLFFYAEDFDTFYKTACWARVNVNARLFAFAFSTAVLRRDDCKGIVLPAPYEIYPHFFVDGNVIQKAYEAKFNASTPDHHGKTPVVITIKNTGLYPYYYYYDDKTVPEEWQYYNPFDYYLNVHPENRLSYFTEDVAVNAYNYYFYLFNPVFLNTTYGYNPEGRGELFFYHIQQLFARYYLERLSNNLLDVDAVDFDKDIVYGYNPNLRYPNGQAFPARPDKVRVNGIKTDEFQLVENFQRRIIDAIDFGFVVTPNGEKVSIYEEAGVDVLGQLVYSTVNSVNPVYYGKLYRLALSIFGHIIDTQYNHNIAPGVLEHYETALRDPLYYRVAAFFTQIYYKYKNNVGPYSYEELVFPGVKVTSVHVNKLVTYFENFEFDISSAVATGNISEDLVVKARQYRLNHKPFNYKVHLTSAKNTNVTVRVFIGPKYNAEGVPYDVNEKRKFMVEIDRFPYAVTVGKHVITRNSANFFGTIQDPTSIRNLYNSVLAAMKNTAVKFYYSLVDEQCGLPSRFLLPKGKREGMPFVFFVAVSPLPDLGFWENFTDFKYNSTVGCGNGLGLFPQDGYAMGFPFDRPVDETTFFVPNFYEKEVVIFHNKPNEV